jgi:hypothetical protein
MFSTPTLLIGRSLVRPYSRHTLLVDFSYIFLPTISTHFRLRSFVRIIRLIRLFFFFSLPCPTSRGLLGQLGRENLSSTSLSFGRA